MRRDWVARDRGDTTGYSYKDLDSYLRPTMRPVIRLAKTLLTEGRGGSRCYSSYLRTTSSRDQIPGHCASVTVNSVDFGRPVFVTTEACN